MTTEIRPQPGPQTDFLTSPADIVIYGGAAGSGKSWCLLMEPLRHINKEGFGAVIFRRTSTQVRSEGGLWDTSEKLYPGVGGIPKESNLSWDFPPYNNSIKFAHLEYEKNKYDWQGAQIPLICFDELTHFSQSMFFYLLSRNRSTCGIKPYVRATCNPDSDSWVAEFISWWIGEDGYPIYERSGILRWFIRVNDEIKWADSAEKLTEQYPETIPKSVTFIPAKLEDNKILMDTNPEYKAKLQAQSLVEQERLLKGNWKIRPAAGLYFKRDWFEIVDAAPKCTKVVRFWDCAATDAKDASDPDWTVGLLLGEHEGIFYVIDVQRVRKNPGEVEKLMQQTAQVDGVNVHIRQEQEPGSSGKTVIATRSRTIFKGFNYRGIPSTGNKIVRAEPVSAAAHNGNIRLVRGSWINEFLAELEGFPERAHDDQVDGLSGAYNYLNKKKVSIPRFSAGFGVSGGMRI